jgi:hypothetical protein
MTRPRSLPSRQLDGIEALRPPAAGGPRLSEVITAHNGYEAALSAVLGALVDAVVAADEHAAMATAGEAGTQVTALFPVEASRPANGSLLHHVNVRSGYEAIALRLLGGVVIGKDVTQEGVYRERGRCVPGPTRARSTRKIELGATSHGSSARRAMQPQPAPAWRPAGRRARRVLTRSTVFLEAARRRGRRADGLAGSKSRRTPPKRTPRCLCRSWRSGRKDRKRPTPSGTSAVTDRADRWSRIESLRSRPRRR